MLNIIIDRLYSICFYFLRVFNILVFNFCCCCGCFVCEVQTVVSKISSKYAKNLPMFNFCLWDYTLYVIFVLCSNHEICSNLLVQNICSVCTQ